jgi:hypothetical protein
MKGDTMTTTAPPDISATLEYYQTAYRATDHRPNLLAGVSPRQLEQLAQAHEHYRANAAQYADALAWLQDGCPSADEPQAVLTHLVDRARQVFNDHIPPPERVILLALVCSAPELGTTREGVDIPGPWAGIPFRSVGVIDLFDEHPPKPGREVLRYGHRNPGGDNVQWFDANILGNDLCAAWYHEDTGLLALALPRLSTPASSTPAEVLTAPARIVQADAAPAHDKPVRTPQLWEFEAFAARHNGWKVEAVARTVGKSNGAITQAVVCVCDYLNSLGHGVIAEYKSGHTPKLLSCPDEVADKIHKLLPRIPKMERMDAQKLEQSTRDDGHSYLSRKPVAV